MASYIYLCTNISYVLLAIGEYGVSFQNANPIYSSSIDGEVRCIYLLRDEELKDGFAVI
jgi:hypothetical protein